MTDQEQKQLPPAFDVDKLDGVDKAAILLLSLSEEDAAQILKHLEPKQVQKVGMAMAALDDLSQAKISAVHNLFIEQIQSFSTIGFQSEDFIKKALTAALGEDKAASLIDQIVMGSGAKGLDSLKWMDSKQVANIIRNEHPQIQTIVLSYLEPEQSAEILSQFPEKVRLDLTMRIANLEEVQPAALQELNEIMEKQFAGQAGAQAAKMGGLKAAADIMNYLDTNIEGQLMDSIREHDEEMSQQIQDLMFVFENLMDVEDRGIQAILREVQQDVLMKAIKGTDEALKEKILSNMSKRAAELLADDLEAMGPVRISEVEAAQKEILSTARRLADSGEIMLGGGGGEEFL
ncbi:flagellar motor switch protein FliG [Pseudoalteromonas sp. SSMSWG5]|jgi:flagellar motor switch protein FliG|uniref:Flagellar motor switch protein FliG n=1 Tax=Pseudoalteromonas lipolytica TaxID=570156 RepID=A0AAD0RXX3_9GAMM|nr:MULTISPECIES: flagellar motor switch protein FliG [Pseudoalteromonas]MBU76964.1 flagellar motor switch protein FliG [Pseudoalteromonadaceae bacterium]AXV64638.1 flagellar motor switch protein FliG [Pseudoalteromonas donghaensis]EWH06126.1 flagellar motor switch protein FliG [Pseudoalteromonas lipolytica SCSIO 04301]MAE02166.1 flagellar motor switch protein FliG [Pseudoalteromonas sp.]MBE0351590.1 flagellar motor switch protein FliG [Pseudoalteromonas lipolytica LMEB 39]|tara:strand:- start:10487 stop:11527 length:1041 start_codon:yes stop_codon:yes gene_type:complete